MCWRDEQDAFVAEREFRRAQLRAFQREQIIRSATRGPCFGDEFEQEHVREELHLAIQIIDREFNRADLTHCRRHLKSGRN